MAYRLDKLEKRRTDATVLNAKMLNEIYRKIQMSESVRYVVGSMQPIDEAYTQACYDEGDRVRNQLEKKLVHTCEYKYQGSVTNGTHIKARSDIDLLAITGKYHSLENPQVAANPYKGDVIQDLRDLRKEATDVLEASYPEADIDTTSNKAITISGGSLRREIDVVPACWFNTNAWADSGMEKHRGVMILDAGKGERIKNTPFLHNDRIESKDKATNGNFRKIARLVKSISYDTEAVELSSYDLVSIVFNIDNENITFSPFLDLALLEVCYGYTAMLLGNAAIRESIYVPDGHRKVFCEGHATEEGLSQLVKQLGILRDDVMSENARSFQRLQDARVAY